MSNKILANVGKIMDGNELEFECCFCGQPIQSTKADPAEVVVRINFDKNEDL